MLLHIFALRWKAAATAEQKAAALASIRDFPHQIPGIEELHAGTNVSSRGQGYETVGVMRFASQAALELYLQHPVHEVFVQSVREHVEAIDLDLNL